MYKFVRSFKKKPLNEDKKEKLNKEQTNVQNTSSNLSSENDQRIDQNDTRKPLSSTKPKSRHESFVNSKSSQSQRKSQSVKRSYSHQKKNTTSSEQSDNQSSPYRSASTSSLTTLSSSTITKPTWSSSSSSSLTTSLQSSTETVNNTLVINSGRDLDLLDRLFSNLESKRAENGSTGRFVTTNFKPKPKASNSQSERKFANIIRYLSETKKKSGQDPRQSMVLSEKRAAENAHPVFKNRSRKHPLANDEDSNEKNSKPLKSVNFRILKNSHRKAESDSSFRAIAQQPVRTSTSQDHYLQISSAPCKRLRSPSNNDYNSLLNLAHSQSHNNRSLRKITIKPLARSLSVNYLYHKRQGDLRRYQKNALIKIRLQRAGFTTEDIDDIYMPKQLDMFERKLKQSMDISDNSELEETKMRQERLSRVRNKRFKCDMDKNATRSKIIINYRTAPCEPAGEQYLDLEKKSYLDEAKRKLDMMKNSNGSYYFNLNNKLKSSVTNLIRASQDLARTAEIKSKFVNRNWSLKEVYDIRRNQIRTNNLQAINVDNSTQIQNNFTCDDIDGVYMPWMIENYGRKLTMEAMRRKTESQTRTKSPYVSQYYAKSNDSVGHHDLWLIDRDIRRHLKNASNSNLSDSDVSMTDTETSSDDTRPIVPQKINKPDNSLKNKILKAINKSLLTSEVSGIDLNLLKLDDSVKRTLKRVEKKALERDLEHDLIRSFSCNHLTDLRKEDIKYINMRVNGINSYSTEDIQDLYIPKMLENFKLKLAVEKECQPRRILAAKKFTFDDLNRALVTSPPPVQVKSPAIIATPVSPQYSNTDNLFKQIIQERISEFDHRIASEISSSAKKKAHDDDVSTDNDQDDSIEISSDSDDFSISEHEMKHFDSSISKSKIESAINKSLTLKNPGELISDFYISNMNFAMRYSVEYIQKIANEMRRRRHQQDSMYFHSDNEEPKLHNRVHRSFSVDRLYAVRKEHLRYSHGAQNDRISFTTDDIQDIYMPFCLDNYKRKIAVELERRRRQAEQTNLDMECEMNQNLNQVKTSQPIVLDDLDIFLIKKSTFSIQENRLDDKVVKIDQPVVLLDKNEIAKRPVERLEKVIAYQPVINVDRTDGRSIEMCQSVQRARHSVEPKPKLQNIQTNSVRFKSAEDQARFKRAKVSIQKRLSFFENYPLVSHIEPVLHDEPIQMDHVDLNEKSDLSSSMTSSVSGESSDSLSNIPMDNFEQKNEKNKLVKDRASVSLVPDDKTLSHRPFRVTKIEQVPILEKSSVNYEHQKFDFAKVNSVKPINMPTESLDIVSRLYSNYFQPEKVQTHEPNCSYVQDHLKSEPLVHKPNDVIYNAPSVERQEMHSVRQDIHQPVSLKRPEYLIEEYAKKSLNSEITYLYENLNSFRVNDLKDRAKVGQYENELVSSNSKYEKTFHVPETNSEDQVMGLPEQIETVNEVNVDDVMRIEEFPQLVPNIASILVPTDVKNAEQVVQEEFELDELRDEAESEKNLSVREEVEQIGVANITEFKQVEEANIDEVSLSDVDSVHFESYELQSAQKTEKIPCEINQPLNLHKNKVYNLPNLNSDLIENVTKEFYPPVFQTDQIEQVKHVQRLELCQQPSKISMLNLARQESILSLKSQAENITIHDQIPLNAASKHEKYQFNPKPFVQKATTFNSPLLENQVYEYLMTNDLETKQETRHTMLSPKKIESLDKAHIEPRPIYLNQAESNVSHEEMETLQYMDEAMVDKEIIESKKEMTYQTKNVQISRPVKALNLGDEKTDNFLFTGTNDYEELVEEPEFAVVRKEEELDSKMERPQVVEVFSSPVISTRVDDFLETVKPLNYMELDFEEQVSISTRKPDLNRPNEVKVSIKQSYGKSDVEEIYYSENCSEFESRDMTVEPHFSENKIDLQSPYGIRVGVVEKIGRAKEETSSIKNEKPIEFKTSYLQSREFVQANFEPTTSMDRLEKFKSQPVLNNPTIGQLNAETVEIFRTDNVDNKKAEINVQDQGSLDKKYVTKIQCYNLPCESYTQGDEQAPIELGNNYNQMESRVSTENVSDYQKDNQMVEILAQIVKQRTLSSYTSDSDDSLENLKKNITMDSMQSFLDNVANTAKQTINSKGDDSTDDETSIQEMLVFNQNFLNQDEKKVIKPDKYKISTISASLSEPVNFEGEKIEMVNGASIARLVEPSSDIKDFEEAVEIVDSVMIDHTSEDDKSTTSEEVTFERWTEETKLIKTQIFKDGNLVEEIVKQSTPELVGNILKEKIIERHEHVKHISQDVLKRVRIKSPGQSRRQSLDIQEILNEDLNGSNIFIVEPTITCIRPASAKDNTYYIQHQQVITPNQSSGTCKCFKNALNAPLRTSTLDFAFEKSDYTFFSTKLPCSSHALTNTLGPQINIENLKDESSLNKVEQSQNPGGADATSNIKTYYGHLKAANIDGSSDQILIVQNDSQLKPSTPNPMKNEQKKDQMIKNQYEKIINVDKEDLSNDLSIRNKSDSIVSITTDSYGSMQRFERPSKSELLKIQQEKQSGIFFYEDQTSTLDSDKNICDKTIDESTFKEANLSKKDDMTDLSEDDNNIFNPEPSKSACSPDWQKNRKNLPLRRESFELAQKDPASRLSVARSTTSSSSSSISANQIIIRPGDSPAPNSNKRLLSEIRPETTDDLNEKSDDAKATEESDSEILKRNYEILRKKTSERGLKTDSDHLDQASFVSSHSIKSEPVRPSVKPTKIKIVKRQKVAPSKDAKFRSVSPGLMRGPDMIETVQTTTSMSFIMNKSINLVTEEKVEKKTDARQHQHSISIPIQVQTRSRSEPKIKPSNEPKEIKVMYRDEKTPRVTFHKYDSNEIIAVVNVPEAMETKTVQSVLDSCDFKPGSKSAPNLTESHNLRSKLDSWKKWPEYTVDQDTDTSALCNEHSHCWIRETPDSRVIFRNTHHLKDKDPEFEIEIEKVLPVHDRTTQPNAGRYSTHSILNTNVTHTEETVATRMSSGYFSGDEFRSQMASYSTSNFTESPRVSATQFNVNKFLNNSSRSRSKTTTALDEFSKFYHNIGLDDALSDSHQPSIKKLIDSENYSDYYYRKSTCSRQPNCTDHLKNAKSYSNRDDASVLNMQRKRSSSMSNLSNEAANLLILPSPTSADYLRNKTRESALVNVAMKPAKTINDIETSQILYDDMAYRQLRKDTDAFKLSQIKSNRQNLANNLTNITSLPISYAPGRNSTGDYYQSSNAARTIRMLKQKDASNKTLRQNSKSAVDMAHRYFSNESNPEINDYYDCLNHVKAMNRNFGNY